MAGAAILWAENPARRYHAAKRRPTADPPRFARHEGVISFMEELSVLLGVRPGVTALVGSGGKTTAMYRLAAELAERGTVLCATTTHIFPPSHLPVWTEGREAALAGALAERRCLCVGTPAEDGKLTAPPLPMAVLAELADFVLVEADGSRGLPLKAHLAHEPAIPPQAGDVILLAGASGLGQTVREAAHQPERFSELAGIPLAGAVTARALANVIRAENLAGKVFLNQVENDEALDRGRALAELLETPVFAGAIRKGRWTCLR